MVEQGKYKEAEAMKVFGQLVQAISYMHEHDVVHCDIKVSYFVRAHSHAVS